MEAAFTKELRCDAQHLTTLGIEHGALFDEVRHPVGRRQDIRRDGQNLISFIGDHEGATLSFGPDPEGIVAEAAIRLQLLQSAVLPLLPGREFITG